MVPVVVPEARPRNARQGGRSPSASSWCCPNLDLVLAPAAPGGTVLETRPRVTQAMYTEAGSSAAALRRPPPPLLLCSWRAGELRRSSQLGAGHVSKLDLNFDVANISF
jgi:hypothetical protein